MDKVPEPQRVISADQIAEFSKFGWVRIPKFFDHLQVTEILRWTDDLVARPEQPGELMVYGETSLLDNTSRVIQRIENFCSVHVEFDNLVRQAKLVEAASAVMGSRLVLFKDKINFKMPGGAGFELHQDQQAGWSRYAPIFVTALVCLDKATLENGCLELSNSPRLEQLIAPEWRPISVMEKGDIDLVPVETEPGDVILFDSFVPHGSGPNLTSAQRRLLYLTYNSEEYGDLRVQYFKDKRANFPPDIERDPSKSYTFRV